MKIAIVVLMVTVFLNASVARAQAGAEYVGAAGISPALAQKLQQKISGNIDANSINLNAVPNVDMNKVNIPSQYKRDPSSASP